MKFDVTDLRSALDEPAIHVDIQASGAVALDILRALGTVRPCQPKPTRAVTLEIWTGPVRPQASK